MCAGLVYLTRPAREHPREFLLTMTELWSAAVLGTGGRPALVMDVLLTPSAERDRALLRRCRGGQAAATAVVMVAAALLERAR